MEFQYFVCQIRYMRKFRLPLLLLIGFTLSTVAFIGQHAPFQNKAQTRPFTYDQYWKKVDSLAKKGLSRSALEVVMDVYQKAKAENDPEQLVKAVIHRMK